MADTHKTKDEILQELESIKGLLLEEDTIPILQEFEQELEQLQPLAARTAEQALDHDQPPSQLTGSSHISPLQPERHPSVLPGQVSLFDEDASEPGTQAPTDHHAHTSTNSHSTNAHSRPLAKATGENPFLPQHIRARLHGNNPPPLFDYQAAQKIASVTASATQDKQFSGRQQLINDVINQMLPKIEQELKQRLYTMNAEDLAKLLHEDV